MNHPIRVVKLLKNHLYPTYQLHAWMANDKTDAKDGLRLAALTTMHWLKSRLGEAAPEAWKSIPSPKDYLTATDEDLPPVYVNQGHVINVVSLLDKGMWALQITEPDLGSDPGNPKQSRQPVPGRIIETNIAFQIIGKQLECGFKTMISDPVGTVPEAEVYRTTVVRLLMENPAFGLKQVTTIPMKVNRLSNSSQVKTALWVTHHAENQLPTVVFTQPVEERKTMPVVTDLSKLCLKSSFSPPLDLPGVKLPKPAGAGKVESVPVEPPYDLEKFAYYTISHCRTYVLEYDANKAFTSQSGVCFRPGDIIVLYPTALGGGERVIPFRKTDSSPEETIRAIELGVKDALKARDVDFGHIMFLSGVREQLLHLSDELLENAEAADAHFKAEIEQLKAVWKSETDQKDQEIEKAAAQLQRQKEYSAKLEAEKTALREEFTAKQETLQAEIDRHLETIEFLKRRYDQPGDYNGIAAWAEEHFSERLLLHPRAIARLETKSAQCAAVDLICDALDYLATDYWEMRYSKVPKEIALSRCSEKYGRPFDVSPIGQITIDFTPGDYRIKYYRNAQGKEIDSDLNYHLRVGNDSENLLRIYFLHDDEKQLIVVGSLPDHLRTVSIK